MGGRTGTSWRAEKRTGPLLLLWVYEKAHSQQGATTLLRRILGVTRVVVEDPACTEEGLVVIVRPRWCE